MKNFVKLIVPPILFYFFKYFNRSKYGWFGNYKSWEDAKKSCTGYDSEIVIDKVKNSLLKVKNGEAVYERDSYLFDKIQYSFPLLASMMWIVAQKHGKLNVIDFGGSLGSTYYQNKLFLDKLNNVRWNIIEQPKFVSIGKEYFENEQLKFFYSIDECLKYYPEMDNRVIILSSVIQYLESPYEFLDDLISKKIEFIIFDRTAFINTGPDVLTVQKVSPDVCKASYPSWFFNETKFLHKFNSNYDLLFDFVSCVKGEDMMYINKRPAGINKGFLFKLRKA